jgi:hypothetical protein
MTSSTFRLETSGRAIEIAFRLTSRSELEYIQGRPIGRGSHCIPRQQSHNIQNESIENMVVFGSESVQAIEHYQFDVIVGFFRDKLDEASSGR